jgi:hypothetical protein
LLPDRKPSCRRDGMGDAAAETRHHHCQDRDPKGNMQRHRVAGRHPPMNARHELAERILYNQSATMSQ